MKNHVSDVAKQIGIAQPGIAPQLPPVKDRLLQALKVVGLTAHIPRQPDARDAKLFRQTAYQRRHGPLGVDMVMRIKVDRLDPCLDNFLQLHP